MTYYCTGVSWEWTHGDNYISALTLDRGHNRGVLTELRRRIEADAPASNPSHFAET